MLKKTLLSELKYRSDIRKQIELRIPSFSKNKLTPVYKDKTSVTTNNSPPSSQSNISSSLTFPNPFRISKYIKDLLTRHKKIKITTKTGTTFAFSNDE